MAARDIHGVEAPWEEFRIVGKSHRKIDGVSKATGEAVYADDILLPGMLHAKTLRSPHAHAKIVSIDTFTPSNRRREILARAYSHRDPEQSFNISNSLLKHSFLWDPTLQHQHILLWQLLALTCTAIVAACWLGCFVCVMGCFHYS